MEGGAYSKRSRERAASFTAAFLAKPKIKEKKAPCGGPTAHPKKRSFPSDLAPVSFGRIRRRLGQKGWRPPVAPWQIIHQIRRALSFSFGRLGSLFRHQGVKAPTMATTSAALGVSCPGE